MSSDPQFSIVMPVFNREREIRRAIDSCLAQTYASFEIVVVDDGSTDRTAAVVADYADSRVRLVRHSRNCGVCPARNTAIRVSKGSWIVFLDSDDEMLPGCLARAAELTGSAAGSVDAIDRVAFQHRFDDGRTTPSPLPPESVVGYVEWLRWIEYAELTDAVWFTRRACFDRCMLPEGFALEFSYALDFTRLYRTLVVPEVVALIHTDAPNRLSAATSAPIEPELRKRQALDRIADWRHVLTAHGAALKRFAPRRYQCVLRAASQSHSVGGQWLPAIRWGAASVWADPLSPPNLVALFLALAGSRATTWACNLRARLRPLRDAKKAPIRYIALSLFCR